MGKILIVDDSAFSRRLLATRMKEHATLEAASLDEVKRLDLRGLDGAILDFELGRETGLGVATFLREAIGPGLSICFLTSAVTKATEEGAHLVGPVFPKDGELRALLDWVRARCQ